MMDTTGASTTATLTVTAATVVASSPKVNFKRKFNSKDKDTYSMTS